MGLTGSEGVLVTAVMPGSPAAERRHPAGRRDLASQPSSGELGARRERRGCQSQGRQAAACCCSAAPMAARRSPLCRATSDRCCGPVFPEQPTG